MNSSRCVLAVSGMVASTRNDAAHGSVLGVRHPAEGVLLLVNHCVGNPHDSGEENHWKRTFSIPY